MSLKEPVFIEERKTKIWEAKLTNPMTYQEAFNSVLAWSDAECRLILFGILQGFTMRSILEEIEKRRSDPIWPKR